MQGAADAIDQRRFARAVGSDQAEPLAGWNRQRNLVQRDKAAEPLAEIVDREKRAHDDILMPRLSWHGLRRLRLDMAAADEFGGLAPQISLDETDNAVRR